MDPRKGGKHRIVPCGSLVSSPDFCRKTEVSGNITANPGCRYKCHAFPPSEHTPITTYPPPQEMVA